jgi:hypothetical protein
MSTLSTLSDVAKPTVYQVPRGSPTADLCGRACVGLPADVAAAVYDLARRHPAVTHEFAAAFNRLRTPHRVDVDPAPDSSAVAVTRNDHTGVCVYNWYITMPSDFRGTAAGAAAHGPGRNAADGNSDALRN